MSCLCYLRCAVSLLFCRYLLFLVVGFCADARIRILPSLTYKYIYCVCASMDLFWNWMDWNKCGMTIKKRKLITSRVERFSCIVWSRVWGCQVIYISDDAVKWSRYEKFFDCFLLQNTNKHQTVSSPRMK